MARRGGYGDPTPGGSIGPMAGVVMVLIGLVTVIAVMQFAPTIGGSIDASTTAKGVDICALGSSPSTITYVRCAGYGNLTYGSGWNGTYNTNLPKPETTYINNVGLITLLITVIIISIALAYLIGI